MQVHPEWRDRGGSEAYLQSHASWQKKTQVVGHLYWRQRISLTPIVHVYVLSML